MRTAILIPLYRESVSPDEQVSLRHLDHFLSAYERIVIKPESLRTNLPGYATVCFADCHFVNIHAYSKLLLSPFFYEAFSAFDYILIYQLDCLVFSSDLDRWCEAGYDYIGAPLFQKNRTQPKLSRVGNGGLSLRRVQGFLEVLRSTHYASGPVPLWKEYFSAQIADLAEFPFYQRWRKKAQILGQVRRGVEWYTAAYSLNEDLFWSDRARLFQPCFKVAPVQTALQFAFERHPRYCFEQNKRLLPFGCHAWASWDRDFWNTFVLG